jgi:ligand-binding sensor domain-containing protein
MDSSGYLWIGSYNAFGGSLICYDEYYITPDTTQSRRLFPENSPDFVTNVFAINVDVNGRIFYGSDEGRLAIITHNGTPLVDDLQVEHIPGNFLKILDMTSMPDGSTWVATAQGLYRYEGSTGMQKVEGFPTNITCMEAESDTILWFGTLSNGLIRYVPSGDTLHMEDTTMVDVADGLISNIVTDMSLDKTRGLLWIATADGISRYELGHTTETVTSNTKATACPNPFSLSRHKEVSFYKVAPYSQLSIYDVRGQLVYRVSDAARNISTSAQEWVMTWRPSGKVVPGTYFYVASVKPENGGLTKTSAGKLLITP